MRKKKITFIDLFAGIGGFHTAMHSVGARCVFASEWDKYARISYEENYKNIEPKLFENIVLPNIRQVVEHWLLRHPEHADNPERSLVLAKSDGARCPFGFLDQRAA